MFFESQSQTINLKHVIKRRDQENEFKRIESRSKASASSLFVFMVGRHSRGRKKTPHHFLSSIVAHIVSNNCNTSLPNHLWLRKSVDWHWRCPRVPTATADG
jgi:hypothetical protein